MTDHSAGDWEEFVRQHEASGVVELDLTTVRPGDSLLVITKHTAYTLAMLADRDAMLTCNRPDRPAGRVHINGCSFGASSSIKRDHLFCGGNLELMHAGSGQVFTTTEIRALQLTQATC